MLHPAVALLLAVVVGLVMHRVDAVQHRWKTLDHLIDGLPAALVAFLFLVLLALTGRPVISLLLVAGGTVLLSVVNRLKRQLFHEPIVFLDAALCMQVIRHPGFYVPYLFPPPVLLGGVLLTGGLAWLWTQEPAVHAGWRWLAVTALGIGAAVVAQLGVIFLPSRREAAVPLLEQYPPTLDANEDFARFGLLASLVLHGLWHVHLRGREGRPGAPRFEDGARSQPMQHAPVCSAHAPHLVLVQAESFFDIRRHLPTAPAALLSNLDTLRQPEHGGTGGPFLVQTHGAYTMRTEFSVLTGLPLHTLGTDAFNPYFTTSRRPVWSLAWALQQAGYRTACIHPFYLSFFRRNRVLPHLGFQELHGIETFADAPHCGPYVSDAALADAVLRWLAASSEPAFVFVITMEAHGPWKPGRLPGGETAMDVYLQHLQHTDAMFGRLARGLQDLERPAWLCGYGDHVGCLPEATGGKAAARARDAIVPTDWLLWSSRPEICPPLPAQHAVRPEALGALLRQVAG